MSVSEKHPPPCLTDYSYAEFCLPERRRHRAETPELRTGRKRCIDDERSSMSSDSEDLSDLEHQFGTDESSDDVTEASSLLPLVIPEKIRALATVFTDMIVPRVKRWIRSAHYITPPDYRIPLSKRPRTSNDQTSPIFVESHDPDSSTILVLPVDGYFRLACPFFVRDPEKYESCALENDLHSLSNVIRHLKKCHSPAHPYYCAVCGRPFDNGNVRDNHVRESACIRHTFKREKAFTRQMLSLVCRKDDRRRREAERWLQIYSIVFPRAEQPDLGAVYLQKGLPLALSMARDYWASKGRGIVGEYLEKEELSGEEQLSEEEMMMLCGVAGHELIRRIVADSTSNRCNQKDLSGEETWEVVEKEQE